MAGPLSSWRDGKARAAIVDFVTRVTGSGADHVPESERIATFDNDGTLWCEQPMPVQAFFLLDRVRELAAADPAIADRDPFKALLEGDHARLQAIGKQGLMEMFVPTHAGMTQREFATITQAWQARARHPQLGRRFVDLVYQPQIELLEYLRANAFKCFVVTSGGIDFVRACSEPRYGIPPEQVIGSSARLRVDISARGLRLVRRPELRCFNDREAKVESIGLQRLRAGERAGRHLDHEHDGVDRDDRDQPTLVIGGHAVEDGAVIVLTECAHAADIGESAAAIKVIRSQNRVIFQCVML